jgi:uncharacterized protein with ParB-like and HNH nuclease domain
LNGPYRYVIPLFQRDYVWKKKEWEDLWDDVVELWTSPKKDRNHFMGALVFVQEVTSSPKLPAFQVIDGQQRLITLSTLLCALRDVASDHGYAGLASEIDNYYLTHPKKDEEHFRVYPRWRDRDQYVAAVGHKMVPGETISSALNFFTRQITLRGTTNPEESLRTLFETLSQRLEFVQVSLTGSDYPLQIFRSLNSTGVELAESDLIRNSMFMKVGAQGQDEFDSKHWGPLERHFEHRDPKQKGKLDGKGFSAFLRDFLMHKGSYVGLNATFEQFERYYKDWPDPVKVVEELEGYVELYGAIRGTRSLRAADPKPDDKLDDALKQLRQLENSTPYPLILNLLDRVKARTSSRDDAAHAIRLVSSFILRRYVSNLTSRTYGKWFVSAALQLQDNPLENLRSFLQDKGFPDDAEFQTAFVALDLYNGNYARAVLKAMEASLAHKEMPNLSEAQVEHIMPQRLTKEWIPMVGPQDGPVHQQWLHTPGNLTLTKYNGELAQKSFLEKRKIFEKSNYSLTRRLYQPNLLIWGQSQIQARGKWLAEIAKNIWINPNF